MDEKELWEQILASAEEVEVPEGLKPENIEKKLKEKKQQEKKVPFMKQMTRYSELAAAVCILIVAGYMINGNRKQTDPGFSATEELIVKEKVSSNEKMVMKEDGVMKEAIMEESLEIAECEAVTDQAESTESADPLTVTDEKNLYCMNADRKQIEISKKDEPGTIIAEVVLPEKEVEVVQMYLADTVLHLVLQETEREYLIDVSDPEHPVLIKA